MEFNTRLAETVHNVPFKNWFIAIMNIILEQSSVILVFSFHRSKVENVLEKSWKMIAEKEWEPWTFKQQCSSIMNVPKRSRVDVKISVINDLNFIYSSHKVVVWLLKMHMSCIHYIYDTFLQCFWSMKALVPINCNCIDKNNQYKVSPFVFHWKKKKPTGLERHEGEQMKSTNVSVIFTFF